ncbi:MAG: two-component sensor histidine kinase [Candidatus Dadabacteria bacterium CSP1-2]|jgi:signal transduction histidine kinase|nr:MAG: two-component sensor histidine kinase [Candidatus Dadabacteria bacterium CSP1-2]
MFLKNPRLLLKSNSFRLITWYTLFFILSSLVINIYAYTVISSFIYEQSRKEIEEDIADLAKIYQENGLEALREDVYEDEEESFLIRLIGNQGNTLISRIPKDWSGFNVEQLEKSDYPKNKEWKYLKGDDNENEFEMTSLSMPDGSTLQLSQKIIEREDLLRKIRKVYIIAIIPIILFAYLGGIFIADRALNPIRQLINTLNSIVASAKIDVRVPVYQTDKLHDELISLFNTMLEKIEALINGMRNVLDNVAHDLRTPMTRLRGTAEMALQSEQNADVLREALSDCIEESERILIMLNTLMDVSEAETGAMKLDQEEMNVAPLIEDVVELYGYVAEEKGVSVYTGFPKELYLTADRNWIRQVLANLLDNAIKYTPTGGRIDIEACRREQEVIITVKDTGVGISHEELHKIWNRLYRGDKSQSQRGLGLGLSLVKAIVGAHRGYVEVSSEPGIGSAFTIYLPL